MAATQKKSSSGSSKTGSSRSGGRKSAQPQKRPIRREVWGGVLCLLTLCLAVSYFGVEAIFIDWLAMLVKGLFGYGYYLMAPAMLGSALILFCHHGKPVRLRVTCAMLIPLFAGALAHMVACKLEFASGVGILKVLWSSGLAMTSGGVLSGALAVGSVAVFSRVASLILFTAILVVLLMVALRLTLGAIIEKNRSRPQYEEEPEEERPARKGGKAPEGKGVRLTPIEPQPRRRTEEKVQIDFPLDDEPLAARPAKPTPAIPAGEEKKKGLLGGFFRPKAESQKTPDQVLTEESAPKRESATVPAPTPAPAPVPAPAPAAPPAAAAISAEPAPKRERQSAAAEVENAAAAVTQEIEERKAAEEDVYQFPPITLLNENPGGNVAEAGAELRNNSRRLSETLSSFGVDATAGDVVHQG